MTDDTATIERMLTLGMAARRIGCDLWHVGRLADRGLITTHRIGRNRHVLVDDLGAIAEAAKRAGFLRTPEGHAVPA